MQSERKLKIGVLIALAGILAGTVGAAPKVRPCTEQEKADLGATHCVTISYKDFTTSTTNTAQTYTSLPVQAKQGVELKAMMLREAFDSASTTYTHSCLLTVGDGNDTDRYLESTELAADGTEVWLKFGRDDYLTQAKETQVRLSDAVLGYTTTTLIYSNASEAFLRTNDVLTAVCVTNTYLTNAVCTNITITAQGTLYTSDDTVDFIFTPCAYYALTNWTAGKVDCYFRIYDAAKRD